MAFSDPRVRLHQAEQEFTTEFERLHGQHQVGYWSILALIKRLFDIGRLRDEVVTSVAATERR